MKVTIIVPDNMVVVDGVAYSVDCSAYPFVHAVQWDGDSGEIEYAELNGTRSLNEPLSDISLYLNLINAWYVARDRANAPKPMQPDAVARLVNQSYRAGLVRQSNAAQAKGKTFEAMQLLLKSKN